jgi:MerR family transcriptional regulator/heat shock protein HspR
MAFEETEPCFIISVAARMVGLHAQTLRYYERVGLVAPSRSRGNRRLYSQEDVERLRRIKTLMDDLGVNLAGVEVIMRMAGRMVEMEREMEELRQRVRMLAQSAPGEAGRGRGTAGNRRARNP